MLRLYIGPAGSGKTAAVTEEIRARVAQEQPPRIQLRPGQKEHPAEHEKQRHPSAHGSADKVEQDEGQALYRDLMIDLGPGVDHQHRQAAEDAAEIKLRSSHVPISPFPRPAFTAAPA